MEQRRFCCNNPIIFPWGMTGFFKPFPEGESEKRFRLIPFSTLCPVGLISSQSPHFTLFHLPRLHPSPLYHLSGCWREAEGRREAAGEGRLQPEASGRAGATSGRVAVDVGIHVIYRTQVLALICIQSLAVTGRWSPRPPLTLPWANQMLDFYNSCFRSTCLKKNPIIFWDPGVV